MQWMPTSFFHLMSHHPLLFSQKVWQATLNAMALWYFPLSNRLNSESPREVLYEERMPDNHFQLTFPWQKEFTREMNLWLQQLIYHYRQGRILSQSLSELLSEYHASFKPETHSALYYHRRLKLLAKQLPLYAHAIEVASDQFQQSLKRKPSLALQYFYQDIKNYLMVGFGKKISLKRLRKVLEYYETILPDILYHQVIAQLKPLSFRREEEKEFAFMGPSHGMEEILIMLQKIFAKIEIILYE